MKKFLRKTGYRRLGFNCESLINANCNFSPRSQLLLCNDRFCVHNSRVNATLQLRPKMIILHYLKPVTNNTFQLITKQDCRAASPRRWTSQRKEQLQVIAVHRTMAQKANRIDKYATENGNAAALGDGQTIDNKYYVTGMGNSNLTNETMHVESIKRH